MKKAIACVTVCVILTVCALFCIPFTRWHLFGMAYKINDLYLTPQSVTCRYGEITQALTKKQGKALRSYAKQVIQELEEREVTLTSIDKTEFVESNFTYYVEFSFSSAYTYFVKESDERIVFDTLMLSCYHSNISLWFGFDGVYEVRAKLDTYPINAVLRRAESMALGNMLGSLQTSVNKEAAVSSTFPAAPTSAVVYHHEAKAFDGEAAGALCDVITDAVENSTAMAYRGFFGYGVVFEQLQSESIVVQLKYDQRQQYKCEALSATPSTSNENSFPDYKAEVADGFTYDSVVFVISFEEGYIKMLPAFACIDGIYGVPSGFSMCDWSCSDQEIVSRLKEYCR